jgi:hypothetical protein
MQALCRPQVAQLMGKHRDRKFWSEDQANGQRISTQRLAESS